MCLAQASPCAQAPPVLRAHLLKLAAGLDSLGAVELRNSLEASLQVRPLLHGHLSLCFAQPQCVTHVAGVVVHDLWHTRGQHSVQNVCKWIHAVM